MIIFKEIPTEHNPFSIKEINDNNKYSLKSACVDNGTLVTKSGIKEVLVKDEILTDFSFGEHGLVYKYAEKGPTLQGKYLDLTSYYGEQNYCHILLDQIPRLYLLIEQAKCEGFSDLHVIINANAPKILTYILDNYFPYLKILEIEQGVNYKFEKLIISSPLAHPIGLANTPLVQFLRNIPENLKAIDSCKKFFIARPKGRRGIVNDEELDKLLIKHGIKKVFLEDLTWEEQVSLFLYAEIIISPHGAGLSNIVFCENSSCKVIELFSDNYGTPAFAILAANLGLEYHPILEGKRNFESNAKFKFNDILAPLNKIELILNEV